MRKIVVAVYRALVWLLITPVYFLGCLCYNKKYLTGRYFNRRHFSKGWKWILQYWFGQKIMRKNSHVPWPVPPHICIAVPENIIFDPDDMQNFHTTGCYFQGFGEITIGRGTYIAPNVGMITANHDLTDLDNHAEAKSITLGEKCWVGMNSMILPGVTLGDGTVVGAGSVVTKSFPEGHCVIAGNPAAKLRDLRDNA